MDDFDNNYAPFDEPEVEQEDDQITFANALEDVETAKSLVVEDEDDDREAVEGSEDEDSENDEIIDDELAPLKVVPPIERRQVANEVTGSARDLPPVMTEFEYEAVIKRRATQLTKNARPLLPNFDYTVLQSPVKIAQQELNQGYLNDYQIHRVKPSGELQSWKVSELMLPKWYNR
jgi:DNA-directed RNA polymerase subunit K/omega